MDAFANAVPFIVRVLRHSKKSELLDARSILYQAYETAYGIHDYIKQARDETVMTDPAMKRPLSSVAMHFAEDFTSTSKYREMARLFAQKNVHAVFGLSWEEFLDLTPDKCEDILLICTETARVTSKETTDTMEALKRAASGIGGGK